MKAIELVTHRDVGVIAEDFYWLWVNDACIFPSGKHGVYGRILWKRGMEGPPGITVMPITSDNRIILNCNFRHATRSWELELPRGLKEDQETLEEAARREAHEET